LVVERVFVATQPAVRILERTVGMTAKLLVCYANPIIIEVSRHLTTNPNRMHVPPSVGCLCLRTGGVPDMTDLVSAVPSGLSFDLYDSVLPVIKSVLQSERLKPTLCAARLHS
jgi:hypothetical protein